MLGRSRRQKLGEDEMDEDNEDASTSASKSVQVPLSAVRRQLVRVLEFFIIVQFTVGAFVFFTGIFLLSWAVTPGTALKAASYMLLAGTIIGRALLGLVGLTPGRSGAMFAYGSLLMCTCVLRTIMILVRMKIQLGAESFAIPNLLSGAPGAQSPAIELIFAIIEASQALCAFYVSWMTEKQAEAEKEFTDQQLELVLINLRAYQQKRHHSVFSKKSSQVSNLSEKTGGTLHLVAPLPPAGHQKTATQPGESQSEVDYFAVYKRYPRQTPTPNPPKSPKIDQEVQQPEEQQPTRSETRKRHLPNRPFTLEYAPPPSDAPKPEVGVAAPYQHQNFYPQQQQHPPQYSVHPYYDSVAQTPPEETDAFEPYSQATSPLLYDQSRSYGGVGVYGATSSRPAVNEFEYSAFNSQYP